MSQCQDCPFATRANPNRADITTYAGTLRTSKRPIDGKTSSWGWPKLVKLSGTDGNCVRWQKLDRIFGFKHPYGEMARNVFCICAKLEEHLAMVFHLVFYSGRGSTKALKIVINGIRFNHGSILPQERTPRALRGNNTH